MKKASSFHTTDTGNAEWLAELYGDRIRYDHLRGRWLVWRKHYWQEDESGRIYRLAIEAVRELYLQSAKIVKPEERIKLARWAINSEQRNRLEAVVSLAKNVRPIADSGKDWDTNPWLFAVKNGVIDLKTGQLRPGERNDRITLHSDIEYDPNAKCPRWLRFLSEVFSEDRTLIDYVHRLCGYSMTGITSEQVYAICYGIGANGKDTLFNALMYVLLQYAYNAPFSTFERTNRTAIPNDLAALERRRLVTSSETNEGTRFNEARVKALSGESPITARYLQHEFFTFHPQCKIWLAVNYKPQVRDTTDAFWRRLRIIPFKRQFKGAARDKHLGEKLQAEAPGILNWLLAGCLAWQKRGLDPAPAAVLSAIEVYRTESDPLAQFLEDKCVEAPQAIVMAGPAYKAYSIWAEGQGFIERE